MQARVTYSQHSQGVAAFLVAAALLIGAAGGYALRGIGIAVSSAQAVPTAGETNHTVLIPRSAREDTEITPFQAPAPRWTHEDDATSSK